MLERALKVIASLRLTVVCLVFALILVFLGTLAQVHEGLYQAQARFFKSWLVFGFPTGPQTKWPILLPGGYLLGSVLLLNLIAAHFTRLELSRRKLGLWLIHFGLILLLVGQLLTDVLSTESAMRLAEGESKNYSQSFHANELVVIDATDAERDKVVAIPERLMARTKDIRHESLPFTVKVKEYWPNSNVSQKQAENFVPVKANQGIGPGLFVQGLKPTVSMDERNTPSAVVEVVTPEGSLGTWFLTTITDAKQGFTYKEKNYNLALRFERHYKPFSLTLHDFRHDKYKGTEIPKNFSSSVRLQNPTTGEDREVLIYMNNPLRYAGETFYQSGYDERDPTVTILQVVRNPGWLTPYLACVLVSLGLVVQFGIHLVGFVRKRKYA